ncbi:MAG TPA: hypothetical protein VHA52_09385, partial [Candidatus Babeliaceae bacterium]|nr:hypothetical protein [Candidatus Babeliaceae bacterium]
MNDKRYFFLIFYVLIYNFHLLGFAGLFFNDKPESSSGQPVSSIERQINTLEKEKHDLDQLQTGYSQERDKLTTTAESLKDKQKTTSSEIFIQKRSSLISQTIQELNDIQKSQEQLQAVIDQELSLLKTYANDQRFENLRKPRKASYNFDDLQELTERLASFRTRIAELEKSKALAQDDLNKRKKNLTVLQEEYKEKERQQAEFGSTYPALNTDQELSVAQQGELLDEQKQLAQYKKDLADIKAKEAERRVSLIELQLAIARDQSGVIKEDYTRVKQSLIVDEQYVQKAERELEVKRQNFVT